MKDKPDQFKDRLDQFPTVFKVHLLFMLKDELLTVVEKIPPHAKKELYEDKLINDFFHYIAQTDRPMSVDVRDVIKQMYQPQAGSQNLMIYSQTPSEAGLILGMCSNPEITDLQLLAELCKQVDSSKISPMKLMYCIDLLSKSLSTSASPTTVPIKQPDI